MKKKWKEIWENRYDSNIEKISLSLLIKQAGFSDIKTQSWKKYVRLISEKFVQGDVLEAGCGCGAFLYPLCDERKVSGFDISIEAIELAKKAIPIGNFKVCEANKMKRTFRSKYNNIVANSIFQYFNGMGYAADVVYQMKDMLLPRGKILVLDVIDAATEKEYIEARRAILGPEEYDTLYSGGFKHTTYKKSIWEEIAKELDMNVEFQSQVELLPKYMNAEFRYNVYLTSKV